MTKYENIKKGIVVSTFILYAGCLIFAIVILLNGTAVGNQAPLIIIQSLVGMAASFVPLILERFYKVKLSVFITSIVAIFLFLAIFLGEVFEFYYRISWWDFLQHFLSGFGIALIGFGIAKKISQKYSMQNDYLFCIMIAVMSSFAIGFIWELCEYTLDSVFGSNMQKFIPQQGGIFNGGFSFDVLGGTDKELADFFRSPNGYKFALVDTMEDMVACTLGNIVFFIFSKTMYVLNAKFFDSLFSVSPSLELAIENTSNGNLYNIHK